MMALVSTWGRCPECAMQQTRREAKAQASKLAEIRKTNPTLGPTSRYCSIAADPDDYVVFDGDRCIGWIFKPPYASPSKPWFWTITAVEFPPSVHNKGYSATREQAMADFKTQWLS